MIGELAPAIRYPLPACSQGLDENGFIRNVPGKFLSPKDLSIKTLSGNDLPAPEAAPKVGFGPVSKGTARAVPFEVLYFLSSRADLSRRGICFSDFFSSLSRRRLKARLGRPSSLPQEFKDRIRNLRQRGPAAPEPWLRPFTVYFSGETGFEKKATSAKRR